MITISCQTRASGLPLNYPLLDHDISWKFLILLLSFRACWMDLSPSVMNKWLCNHCACCTHHDLSLILIQALSVLINHVFLF